MYRTRLYRDGKCVDSDFDPAVISDMLEVDDGSVVWLDLEKPTVDDLKVLTEEAGLSPVAVEDATSPHQRSKLDHYDGYAFLNLYALQLDDDGELVSSEVSVFISTRYLVTVRKSSTFDIHTVTTRWDDNTELADNGVGFLLWGLLDVIVDGYFDVVQTLDGVLDDLEDMLFGDHFSSPGLQRRTYDLRKSLSQVRRITLPMRDVLASLSRSESPLVPASLLPYVRDVHDHVLQASDWGDSLRDQASTINDTRLALQSNQMNEVMKKVTSWAAIIAVPAVVTGYYGMNVRIFPDATSLSGGIVAIALMVVTVAVLWVGFKKRDWL